MHVRPKCECDLPDIVLLKVTSLHGGSDHVGDRIEGWGAARTKVFRKPSGAGARARENVVKNAWPGESIIYISFQCGSYPGFHSPAERMRQNVFEKLGKFSIRNVIEQRLALRKIVIDGHRSDVHSMCNTAHADGFRAFSSQNLKRHLGDLFPRGL